MKSIFFVTLLVLSLATTVAAQAPTAAPANTSETKPSTSNAEKYFTDIELVNQNGEKMRFYHDLLQGKRSSSTPSSRLAREAVYRSRATSKRFRKHLEIDSVRTRASSPSALIPP
jgi:hypothetical protein